jgi:hypothetical protein
MPPKMAKKKVGNISVLLNYQKKPFCGSWRHGSNKSTCLASAKP